jgi:prolyl-tRNA synthetase
MVGGLIMMHGDDDGLLVPPRLAPVQVVVVPVRDEPDVRDAADALVAELLAAGVRVEVDRGRGSFGRRVTDWEIKGVPLRVEVGPRDLAQGLVTMVRRDTKESSSHALGALAAEVPALLDVIQRDLFARALAHRDERTSDVATIPEALEAAKDGFARLDWDVVAGAGEAALNEQAVSVRCLQRRDGTIPASDDEGDLVCLVAKSY